MGNGLPDFSIKSNQIYWMMDPSQAYKNVDSLATDLNPYVNPRNGNNEKKLAQALAQVYDGPNQANKGKTYFDIVKGADGNPNDFQATDLYKVLDYRGKDFDLTDGDLWAYANGETPNEQRDQGGRPAKPLPAGSTIMILRGNNPAGDRIR